MGYGTVFNRTGKRRLTEAQQKRFDEAKERYNEKRRKRNHSSKKEGLNKLEG